MQFPSCTRDPPMLSLQQWNRCAVPENPFLPVFGVRKKISRLLPFDRRFLFLLSLYFPLPHFLASWPDLKSFHVDSGK